MVIKCHLIEELSLIYMLKTVYKTVTFVFLSSIIYSVCVGQHSSYLIVVGAIQSIKVNYQLIKCIRNPPKCN